MKTGAVRAEHFLTLIVHGALRPPDIRGRLFTLKSPSAVLATFDHCTRRDALDEASATRSCICYFVMALRTE